MYAAIDIGTNSVRLLIAKYENNVLVDVYKALKTTRLGEGVAANGVLGEEAISRTLAALKEFKRICEKFRVVKQRVVATSAVREARNQKQFLEQALHVGLKVEVISGEEEARLSFKGAAGLTPEKTGSTVTVIDIGGGSTEIIYNVEEDLKSFSIPIGAVRCTEEKWSREKIQRTLQPVLEQIIGLKDKRLIGVGGTITTLAAIDQKLAVYNPELVQDYILSLEKVREIRQHLAALTLEERKKVPGLQPSRADIIIAGIDILLAILIGLGVGQITVSERDILDGIILELISCSEV